MLNLKFEDILLHQNNILKHDDAQIHRQSSCSRNETQYFVIILYSDNFSGRNLDDIKRRQHIYLFSFFKRSHLFWDREFVDLPLAIRHIALRAGKYCWQIACKLVDLEPVSNRRTRTCECRVLCINEPTGHRSTNSCSQWIRCTDFVRLYVDSY